MDSSKALESKTPEEIRAEIEMTRSSLGTKIDALNQEVREKVDDAKQQIAHTREKFSLSYHVQQNPWGTFAGAVGVGLLLGRTLRGGGKKRSEPKTYQAELLTPPPQLRGAYRFPTDSGHSTEAAAGAALLGLGEALTRIFDDEMKRALSVAADAVWQEARKTMPTRVTGPIDRVYDRFMQSQASRTEPTILHYGI